MDRDDDGPTIIEEKFVPPPATRDFQFFYEGLKSSKLLIQKCSDCGKIRIPPSPMCPSCQSLSWSPFEAKREGKVYSFVVHHRPPLPFYPTPHSIALVDMVDGFRMLAGFHAPDRAQPNIGDEVAVHFKKLKSGHVIQYFAPSRAGGR